MPGLQAFQSIFSGQGGKLQIVSIDEATGEGISDALFFLAKKPLRVSIREGI